jgi:hypothetical protein
MAERIQIHVFKGVTLGDFQSASDQVAERIGRAISWNTEPLDRKDAFLVAANQNAVAVCLNREDALFVTEVAKSLKATWMSVRMQEGELWDYSLYRGEFDIHTFTTFPAYWGMKRLSKHAVRNVLDELCREWGCSRACVEKYMVQWKVQRPWYPYAFWWITWIYPRPTVILSDHWYFRMFMLVDTIPKGKAYDSDKAEYGDCWQMIDFLRAIGAPVPLGTDDGGSQHSMTAGHAGTQL